MTVSKVYLFKRPNGIWYILYKSDGRLIWKTTKCTNRTEALKKLTHFKELIKSKPPSSRLSSFTQDFLTYARTIYSKSTVDIFLTALRNLQMISGDCILSSICHKHVDMLKVQRLNCVSPTSVNVELRALRSILNTALRWNMIESNPFSRVRLVRVPEKTPAFFTKADCSRFVATVGGHWIRDIFIFAVMTGMRRGEILNLRWTDINLDRKIIHIESSTSYSVKAGKRRTIPLSEQAVNLLGRRQRDSKSEFVFDLHGERVKERYVTKKLKWFVRKAGLNETLHFHSCRHTTATWLV